MKIEDKQWIEKLYQERAVHEGKNTAVVTMALFDLVVGRLVSIIRKQEEEGEKLSKAAKVALEHLVFSYRREDIQEALYSALKPYGLKIEWEYLTRMPFLTEEEKGKPPHESKG